MNAFKWIVKKRMLENHIENLLELSNITGLGYQTMRSHIDNPERLKIFELNALDDVLHFEDCEIVGVIRGMK